MRSFGSRRGGILFGLTLSGLVILSLVVVCAVFVVRNIHVETGSRHGGDIVSIDTPAGHLSVLEHARAGSSVADVPLYPGARREEDDGGDAVIEWTSADGATDKGFGVSASKMFTPDSLDKVLDYYRTQLPDWVVIKEKDGTVRLELRDGGYKRFVVLHEEHDGTHIAVASVGEPASN